MLDMLLSAHPRVVGLGETYQLIDPETRRKFLKGADENLCNCGKTMRECPVWSPFVAFLRQNAGKEIPFAESYNRLIASVRDVYGDDVVIGDSSKYQVPLRLSLENRTRLDVEKVSVIHLIKDARSFALSWKRSHNLGPISDLKAFLLWFRFNKQIESILRAHEVEPIRVGYEELCFSTRTILEMICLEVGLEFDAAMLDLSRSKSHIALGNRMRVHEKKSKKLYYDNRWFLDNSIGWKYAMLPFIKKYNEEKVYGNTIAGVREGRFEPK